MIFHTLKINTRLISLLFITIPVAGYAGRPMVVDDAALVAPHSCQLETWMQKNPDNKEYWAVPACNLGGNFELALGMGKTNEDEHAHYAVIQGKTLLKPLETNDWGLGLSIGTQINTKDSSQKDWAINIPISVSMLNDDFLVHANLGWLREGATHQNQTTWGIGTETQVAAPLTLTTEVYGNDREDSFYQAGFRYMLYKDAVQFNASYGDQISGHNNHFFSVGFVFLTDAFLP